MPARLKHVDPHRPPSRLSRLYASVAATRLGRWLSVHLMWKVDPHLMRLTGGRLGMGLVLPTALLRRVALEAAPSGATSSSTSTTATG